MVWIFWIIIGHQVWHPHLEITTHISPNPVPLNKTKINYDRSIPAVHNTHKRRIKTEAKEKVVASIWGTEFIQFLATLAVVHYRSTNWRKGWLAPGWFEEKDEFILFFKIVLVQIRWSVFILLLWVYGAKLAKSGRCSVKCLLWMHSHRPTIPSRYCVTFPMFTKHCSKTPGRATFFVTVHASFYPCLLSYACSIYAHLSFSSWPALFLFLSCSPSIPVLLSFY